MAWFFSDLNGNDVEAYKSNKIRNFSADFFPTNAKKQNFHQNDSKNYFFSTLISTLNDPQAQINYIKSAVTENFATINVRFLRKEHQSEKLGSMMLKIYENCKSVLERE